MSDCCINYNYRKMIAFNDTQTQANGFPPHFPLIPQVLQREKFATKQTFTISRKQSFREKRLSYCFLSTYVVFQPYIILTNFLFNYLFICWTGKNSRCVSVFSLKMCEYLHDSLSNGNDDTRWKQETFRLSLCAVKLNLFASSMALWKRNKNKC